MAKPDYSSIERLCRFYLQASKTLNRHHAYGPLDDRDFLAIFLAIFGSFSRQRNDLAFDLFELKKCLFYLRKGVEQEGKSSPLARAFLQAVRKLEEELLDFLSYFDESYLTRLTELLTFYGTYTSGSRFIDDAQVRNLYGRLLRSPSPKGYKELHSATLAFLEPACEEGSWWQLHQPKEFEELREKRDELDVQYLLSNPGEKSAP